MGKKLLTTLFLVLLAIAWIAVFLPALVRARRAAPLSTSERFRQRMDLIAPRLARSGRFVVMPRNSAPRRYDRRRAQRQRARLLVVVSSLVPITAVVAVLRGDGWWTAQVAADFSLALYVVLLREATRRGRERALKVRPLVVRSSLEGSATQARVGAGARR